MGNFKKILSITLGGIILIGTTSLAATGIVNAPNGLILRGEASKSGEIIMTVSDKSEVEIIEEDGEWYKVKYNSHEGYLFAEYVETSDETEKEEPVSEETTKIEEPVEVQTEGTEETEKIEEKEYPKTEKVKSNLEIYSIPSVTAKTIVAVEKDAEVTINYELNSWVNVTCGNVTGWARKYFLNNETIIQEIDADIAATETPEEPKAEEEKESETPVTVIDNKKGYVDVSTSANIREKASTDSAIINTLLRNTEVTIVAEEGDFYKIKYQDITGYISKSLISDKPLEEVTSRGNGEERETVEEEKIETKEEAKEETTTVNSSKGNDIAAYAKKYVGYNYVSGGTTPSNGFDCSGFVYYIVNQCGYSLSRSCQVQANSGVAVSRENLTAGDLLFFCNGANGSIGHVGIYIGGGQFVHAANSKRGVTTDTINSGYYDKYYYSARRIAE